MEKQKNILIFLPPALKSLKRKSNCHSGLGIAFLRTNEFKLRSEATSLFDVQR
jgi:hypothetical protein